MKKILIFICTILLAAYTGQSYDLNDTVAVLEGEKITVEDVLAKFFEKRTKGCY
ncbi:hypothetical protein [Salibacterium salarium]|uniref:hypothetical protein n=1 Tax=Salibacterium salarium TaxID=284579 RepID=UPI00163A54D3|nr:hypothetical protein [Salibacterium salarium]